MAKFFSQIINNHANCNFYLFCLQSKSADSKKAKKDKSADADSDDDEAIDDIPQGDSEIESDEYDIPYDGEEDDIECEGKCTLDNPSKTHT